MALPLASSTSPNALEDAAQPSVPAITDTATQQAELKDGLDSFEDSDLMSEIGDSEKATRQQQLDSASAGFLSAVPTGIVDTEGLQHYSDDTWRPAGINYGPTTEVFDMSTPPPEVFDMSTPPPEETGPVVVEVSMAKRTRALSPDRDMLLEAQALAQQEPLGENDLEALLHKKEPSSGSEAWTPVDAILGGHSRR